MGGVLCLVMFSNILGLYSLDASRNSLSSPSVLSTHDVSDIEKRLLVGRGAWAGGGQNRPS